MRRQRSMVIIEVTEAKGMTRGRVAVVCSHPLFGRGIAQLLEADDELEVTCLTADSSDTSERLRRLRPHAIVVEEPRKSDLLRNLARDVPLALLIEVRSQDNVMDVYQNWQVVVAQPEDLLRAVHLGIRRRARQSPPVGKLAQGAADTR